MKTIVIFAGYLLPNLGGIERYIDKISREFNKRGYKVMLVTSNHTGELPNIEEKNNIKVYRLPVYKLFRRRYAIPRHNKSYKDIFKELENTNIDCIIVNTRFHLTTLVGLKLAKRKKMPVTLIEHGANHLTINNKVLDFLGSLYEKILTIYVKRNVTKFYAVSKASSKWLEHFKIRSSGEFYNNIEASDYKKYEDNKFSIALDKDEILITFSGRLIEEKGILMLIQAFKELLKNYHNIKLAIAGDGPLYNKIKNEENENIIVLGKLNYDEIMSLYNITDILINPSYSEGLPTALLEGGLMKCAIVATDRGGTIEIIPTDEYGIIVDYETKDIYKKLKHLLDNTEKIEKLRENIHKRIIEKFSTESTVDTIIQELNI